MMNFYKCITGLTWFYHLRISSSLTILFNFFFYKRIFVCFGYYDISWCLVYDFVTGFNSILTGLNCVGSSFNFCLVWGGILNPFTISSSNVDSNVFVGRHLLWLWNHLNGLDQYSGCPLGGILYYIIFCILSLLHTAHL